MELSHMPPHTENGCSDKCLVKFCQTDYVKHLHCDTPLRHQNLLHSATSSKDQSKWMVMGPGRLFLKRALRNLASLHLSSLLFLAIVVLLISTSLGRSNSRCKVDGCINTYKRADRRLMAAEERSEVDVDLSKRRCRVLKKLHRCLQKMHKACRGNLIFHSIKHMNDRNLLTQNCSEKPKIVTPNTPKLFPAKPDPETPILNSTSPSTTPLPGEVREDDICSYAGTPDYRHCGMFGDPHLRTFSDTFFTCKIEKTWPLVANDYVVVMVTNVPVKEGTSATVTTKITVLIKPFGDCASQQHYVATSERLPGAFTDGSSTTGSVAVVEVDPGRHVEIRARFIATTIIVRSVGRYLTFAIRMPREFVDGRDPKPQLCADGCSVDQRITSAKRVAIVDQDLHSTADHHTLVPAGHVELTNALPGETDPASDDEGSKSSKKFHHKHFADTSLAKKSTPTFYSETEARIKCKHIMLAATQDQDDTHDGEMKTRDAPNRSEKPDQTFHTSKGASSLLPSPRRKSKKGRRKNRMAAAKRPQHDMSQSSFNQLSGSEERETDVASIGKSSRRRQNRKKKNKSKRHVGDRDNSANTETSSAKRPACATNTNDNSIPLNFYFESCVFDLITTGNINFTLTARAALEDVRSTHVLKEQAPGASMEVIKQWQPENLGCPPDHEDGLPKDSGGVGATSSTLLLALCLVLSCFYTNSASWRFSSSTNTVNDLKQRKFQNNMTFSSLQRTSKLFCNVVVVR